MGVFSKSENERDERSLTGSRTDLKSGANDASGKTLPATMSTLGHGVIVTGNIIAENTLQIFGRVNGDIHASHLIIKEGAQVEGNVVAEDAVILGICKGIIRGNTVKLQGAAAVDGEIYSKSLSIEHEARFEGISRRLDKPVDAPAGLQAATPAQTSLAPAMPEAAAKPANEMASA